MEKIIGWNIAFGAKGVKGKAKDHIYKLVENIEWKPHPINKNVDLGFIITKKEDEVEVTCIIAKVPKGESIPEHNHEVQDIIVPLSGKGKFWIEGLGEFEMKKGVIFNIPPGVVHKLYDVTEDLEIFDVFSGPIL
jgi:quercetin dioxygenase-like cupin family protein